MWGHPPTRSPFEVVYNGEVHVPKDIIDRKIQGMMSDFFYEVGDCLFWTHFDIWLKNKKNLV
jgi:hypothetical protein